MKSASILLWFSLGCGASPSSSPADAGTDADTGTPCADADADGVPDVACGGEDCNDADPSIRPGLDDPPLDGVDRNCDGSDGVDVDGDGYPPLSVGGDDCDDEDAWVHPGAPDEDEWSEETIDEDVGQPNHDISIAVDADGGLHLAFHVVRPAGETGDYMYVTDASGSWRVERIDAGMYGQGGLVLDDAGDPHLLYAAIRDAVAYDYEVRHAWRDAGGWDYEVAFDLGDRGAGSVTAAIAPDGSLHAAFSATDEQLRYATNASGAWQTSVVGETCITCRAPIAVDPDGRVTIAFTRGPLYALEIGGEQEVVDEVSFDADPGTLRVDAEGVLHLAYSHETHGYARRDDTGWHRENAGRHMDDGLGIDRRGNAHMAFDDFIGQIQYATNANESWTTEIIGEGEFPTLDVFEEVEHVFFWRVPDLVHMWRNAPDGVDDDCDGARW